MIQGRRPGLRYLRFQISDFRKTRARRFDSTHCARPQFKSGVKPPRYKAASSRRIPKQNADLRRPALLLCWDVRYYWIKVP
jgi:hypothetical protein